MRSDNPAAKPCQNIDKGPTHNWLRRSDGTAYCTNCGLPMTREQADEAFPVPSQLNKKASGAGTKPEA